MPNYRFTGLTPRFYPDVRGDDGRSLMALPGAVHNWDRTPDDGQWTLVADAPEPDFQAVPAPDPVRVPEPAGEAPVVAPVPEATPPAPEPAPAPVAPTEPIPALEPEPAPVAEPTPQVVLDWYASLGVTPPARA